MHKKLLLALIIIILFYTGCKHSDTRPLSAKNNYLFAWHADTDYVLLQNYRLDTDYRDVASSLRPTTLITATVDSNDQDRIIMRDDTFPLLKMPLGYPVDAVTQSYSRIKSRPAFWDYPFKPDTSVKDYLYNSLVNDTLRELQLQQVIAQHVNYHSQGISRLTLTGCQVDYLAVNGYFIGSLQPLYLVLDSREGLESGEAMVSYKTIRKISLDQKIRKLRITQSAVADSTAEISGTMSPDTLELDTVEFLNPKARLNLRKLGVLKDNLKKRIVLICRNTDISKIDLDYTQFKFLPLTPEGDVPYLNAAYSYDKRQFGRLINVQRSDYNEGGLRQARIDSARFEDKVAGVRPFVISLRDWWNGYGFEKYKIFDATSVVFLLLWIVNWIFFPFMIETYEITEIKTTYLSLPKWSKKRFLLPIFFTAYVFFGLKLDFDRLKLKYIAFAIIILLEYIAGIIALAYMANLVLAK